MNFNVTKLNRPPNSMKKPHYDYSKNTTPSIYTLELISLKRPIPILVVALFIAHISPSLLTFSNDLSEETLNTNSNTGLLGFQEGDYHSSTTFSSSINHLCWIDSQETIVHCMEKSLISENSLNSTNFAMSTGDFSASYGEPDSVIAGLEFACSITTRSLVICWTYESMNSHSEGVPIGPENVVSLDGKPASTISSFEDNFCTIVADRSIWCWGAIISQDSSPIAQFTSLRVIDGTQYSSKSLSVGETHSCSITYEQIVICWNNTNPGKIIEFDSRTISQTGIVDTLIYPVSISAGFSELCILHSDYAVNCWKYSDHSSIHEVNLSLENPIVISSGGDYFCTINSTGSMGCWGAKDPFSSFSGSVMPAISLTINSACFVISDSLEISCITGDLLNTSSSVLSGAFSKIPSFDLDSDFVTNNFDLFPLDADRSAYCSNGYFGKFQCTPSRPGHFVSEVNAENHSLCNTGTFQTLFAQESCIPSPPGHYVPSEGAAEPTPCPAGTFHNLTGATSPDICEVTPPGFYSNSGTGNPNPCPAGTFHNLTGATSPEQCSGIPTSGFYSPPGSHSPTPSPPGHYVPSEGAAEPTPCPAGNYLDAIGATSPELCEVTPIGHYSESGGQLFPCPPGTFLNETGATSSDQCKVSPAGFFSPAGASLPVACPPGKWQSNSGSQSCFDSETGHFSELLGSTEQTPCSEGTYQELTGQNHCLIASRGHFAKGIGSTSQIECLPGQFQPDYASKECLEASPGNFVEKSGSFSESPCLPGYFQDNIGSVGCKISPINHFASNLGSIKPTLCPDGSENNLTGEQDIFNCKLDSDMDGIEDMSDEFPYSKFNFRSDSWLRLILSVNVAAVVLMNRKERIWR